MSERREQILRAAAEIAAEQGMSAVTVRSVALRAGIGASTLRHYFPTQQALYDALVGQLLDAQLDDLRIHDWTVPPAQRLAECLGQFLPATDGSRAELEQWLLLHASSVGPNPSDQARHLLAVLTARGRQRVDAWLEALAAEGVLRHADLRRHAIVLLALLDGLSLSMVTPESTVTVAEAREVLADAITQLVTSGVETKGGVGLPVSGS
jgi:AcrR family transcriptional regulator